MKYLSAYRRVRTGLLVAALAAAGCGPVAAKAVETAAGAAPGFVVFPDSATAFNPRVPVVPPSADGPAGWRMDVETEFTYALAPAVGFPDGGSLTVRLRDNLRREARDLVVLEAAGRKLAIHVARASEGRGASVTFSGGKEAARAVPLPGVIGAEWAEVKVQWNRRSVTCFWNGQPAGETALPEPFDPTTLLLKTYSVGALELKGAGRLALDWSRGYAAAVTPRPDGKAVTGRMMGFDAFYVSDKPSRRDFPMVQLLNGTGKPRTVTMEFDLRSEVNHVNQFWKQTVELEPRSGALVPVAFPSPLASDVYHLHVRSQGFSEEMDADKHFASVERRDEVPGPPLFGLHDASRHAFGYWPDALPIPIAHLYSYWGYTVGPAWVRDFNGQWGIDPQTPAEEWNWDRRLEWVLGQGLIPYVCVQSIPLLPWMREREYAPEHMQQHAFGRGGGFPKLELYEKFVRELATRYRGRVTMYEPENEPNAHGHSPQDYMAIAESVAQTVHAVDARAQVYGMCVTGDFVPWITEAFQTDKITALDGISVHTYVSPAYPEQANLDDKLDEVEALVKKAGKPLRLANSETGTYVAQREVVDQPIPEDRLAALIDAGAPNLTVPRGWPNHAVSETKGSISVVRNVVYNFLAGSEMFVFFGWNPTWPSPDWWTKQQPYSFDCFGLIAATKDGVRTPTRYSLAMGVLTAQLEGLLPGTGTPVGQNGILGGVFDKRNGGQVAILWSALGKRSAILKTEDPSPEIVSLWGNRSWLPASDGLPALHALELDEEPIYIHLKEPGIELAPSPVINVEEFARDGEGLRASFTLVNRGDSPWKGKVALTAEAGWQISPAEVPFELAPRKRQNVEVKCVPPADAARGVHTVEVALSLPDESRFVFPLMATVRATAMVAQVSDGLKLDQLAEAKLPSQPLPVNQLDQVVVGRAPGLASLQEKEYWAGPEELSASVQLGSNAEGLLVYVRVQDAQPHLPTAWPGVHGSAVELFFDFRGPKDGFGESAYGPGAYQVILRPSLSAKEPVAIWNVSERTGVLADTSAAGGRLGPHAYWVAFQIPWSSIPQDVRQRGMFGFDVAIDGPDAEGTRRKSQLVWAGTANNNQNASSFGLATLPPMKEER